MHTQQSSSKVTASLGRSSLPSPSKYTSTENKTFGTTSSSGSGSGSGAGAGGAALPFFFAFLASAFASLAASFAAAASSMARWTCDVRDNQQTNTTFRDCSH